MDVVGYRNGWLAGLYTGVFVEEHISSCFVGPPSRATRLCCALIVDGMTGADALPCRAVTCYIFPIWLVELLVLSSIHILLTQPSLTSPQGVSKAHNEAQVVVMTGKSHCVNII